MITLLKKTSKVLVNSQHCKFRQELFYIYIYMLRIGMRNCRVKILDFRKAGTGLFRELLAESHEKWA